MVEESRSAKSSASERSAELGEGIFLGTGRRKSSVARVRLVSPGAGRFEVNGRQLEDFLPVERHRLMAQFPLDTVGQREKVDIVASVSGGGLTGQAGALRLGIARALLKAAPDTEEALRDVGHLTRDSRMKERKHFGFRGARRGTQFSKR